jgi:hypothetical protein
MVTPATACGGPDACYGDPPLDRLGKPEHRAMISQTFHGSIGRPLDSADYLISACFGVHIPTDSSTCDDFGFTKVFTASERSRLWFLYALLIDSGLVNWDSRRLLDLRERNVLGESIKCICSANTRDPILRACSLWVVKNQHVFDATSPCLDKKAIVLEGLRRAWRQIGLEDASDQTILETASTKWSKAQSEAFVLYASVLLGVTPSGGINDIWIDFGFCACPNASSEEYLLKVYRVLMESCSFEEFCRAFESRQLLELLQKYVWNKDARRKSRSSSGDDVEELEFVLHEPKIYDPNYHRETIPHLASVLERGSAHCDAVWRLKQFVLSDESLPWSSVITQYGFFNCRNTRQRFELKEVYKKLLIGSRAIDPMDLQSASKWNEIFKFACNVIPLPAKFKKLMRNLSENGEEKYVLARLTLPKETSEELGRSESTG